MNIDALNSNEINYTLLFSTPEQDDIIFDGYSLQNIHFITSRLDYDDLWTIELNSFKFPRSNGGGVLSKYYRGRTIKLTGSIKADTEFNFNVLLDEVKKNTRKTEGLLEITINWEVRQILATVTDLSYNRDHYHITYSPITITFQTAEPFFYAKQDQILGVLAKTATFTEEMTHDGCAESNPNVIMSFWSWSAVTAVSFTDPDGRILTVSTSLVNSDILVIDCEQKIVTKNSVEIDYTGAFPIFSPGTNNFTITITWTVLVDTTISLPKNYL